KSVRTRGGQLQKTVLTIIDACKVTDLAQVAAQQSKVVAFVQPAQPSQGICCRLVIQTSDKGVTGICGDGNQAAFSEKLASLIEQPGLGIFWVNDKKLGHLIVS